MKYIKKFILYILIAIIVTVLVVYFNLPTTRMNYTSELIMLGDLDNNNKWDNADSVILGKFIKEPFDFSDEFAIKVDINKNGGIDEEDLFILNSLFVNSDPYINEQYYSENGRILPKPREYYKYFPINEYKQRPVFLLKNPVSYDSPFRIILDSILTNSETYEARLRNEIYDEALRFTFRYKERVNNLTAEEQKYANDKIAYCNSLYQSNDLYSLLLDIVSLVEDAETLSVRNQSDFIRKVLYFREHLRELLTSTLHDEFVSGNVEYTDILKEIELHLKSDLNLTIDFFTLESPRDLTKIENYLDRAEWQFYKSKTKKSDFETLVLFAQYNRRYLRCVSKTNPKHQDIEVRNHNLPMILLYREALRIMNGDKKSAVGLLDESIRIPFAWVKSIPIDNLPSSIALENYLLPGNKEDGADKSRHWNVFGGISIYETPEKSLMISLQREINDLKDNHYAVEAMDEFIRDLIANVNGIYYVSSIDIDVN